MMNQATLSPVADSKSKVIPVLPIQLEDGLSLDVAQARRIGEELSEQYCFAEPYPHIVLDNFLPEAVAKMAIDNFPKQRLKSDHVFERGYAGLHKRQILPEECNANARQIFHFFNSKPVLEFLESLSSIEKLIPDPHFEGGGFHETARGGKLGIHADFRINERLNLHRRMNLIVYLNEQWKDEYGGSLELWDRKMTAKHSAVSPIFNRCVIFNTDADSYHGHPDPLTTPDGVLRRSMALYYYTASKQIYDEIPNTGTLYQSRPDDDKQTRQEARELRLHQHLRNWVPPVMLRYVLAAKRRLSR
jgi:hypothetical protein